MTRLHRHQLVHPTPAAWDRLRAIARDATERDCLTLWAARGLPLVVTQQRCDASAQPEWIAMGLSAPLRWESRRIGVSVARREVMFFDEFPAARAITKLIPAASRVAWDTLCRDAGASGVQPRVYGSYGWQALSAMAHVRADSDADLWMGVSGAEQADEIAALLANADIPGMRLDGELVFDGDSAVSWREWLTWRAGGTRSILVKSIGGSRLASELGEIVRDVRAAA
ncbi:malonate decarboxylase holo-[acyl-carrier-protein] synthase [Mitsuaria sp. GD03876]|uniref:malonate decarboxylase holo-[acyl-carrier-protein] synthase n=1 Tax=Mitsuaria sp. GD03876 TaxID=2975399 RepID=UPI00244B4DAA|nr:malonate decarboxylase holo-[acyl-carrier-protein] synthase [Mitsuaria sp. GD03876]MDH0867328.1 malonate decarboxylase holo-[acyl-carrier-protein] synthase [Mitsuaria sp. GD03876]